MRDVLAELFASKKFIAMISGVVLTVLLRVAGKLGLALDADTAKQAADAVALMVASYCVGQGLADHSKEAAKVNAAAVTATSTVAMPVITLPDNTKDSSVQK